MTRVFDVLARLFVAVVFGPVDRTVCAWSNRTGDAS